MVGTYESPKYVNGKIEMDFSSIYLFHLVILGGINSLTTEEIWLGKNLVIFADSDEIVRIQQNHSQGFSGYYHHSQFYGYDDNIYTKEYVYNTILYAENIHIPMLVLALEIALQ